MKPTVKEITGKYFPELAVDSAIVCSCNGGHYYCLQCSICRAEDPHPELRNFDPKTIGNYMDHTNLKPDVLTEDIYNLCREAVDYRFFSVCVNPSLIMVCKKNLIGSSVKVCSVISFPLGATITASKIEETHQAINMGANELDMVINISHLKERRIKQMIDEIESIAQVCHDQKVKLKCIIETCLLCYEEKVLAALIIKKAGADFVKTSTGFSKSGAKVEDVRLLRMVVGSKFGVKASGGIKNLSQAIDLVSAGASRIGSSSSVGIVSEIE